MPQQITPHKTKPHTVSVQAGRNSPMELDFRPLVDRYGLEGTDAVLLHWQSFPKKTYPAQEEFRIFGAYDVSTDTYHSFQAVQWEEVLAPFDLVQLDESLFFSKPVACCLFRGCRLKVSGQLYTLQVTSTPPEGLQDNVSLERSSRRRESELEQLARVETVG
ncbi:MAG: hypothetical protein AAGA60_30945 [Cyanobacteria bacterium P01_E01_bin.42]